MSCRQLLSICCALLLAGCQSPTADSPSAPDRPKLDRDRSVEITPVEDAFDARRMATVNPARPRMRSRDQSDLTEDELYHLPKFTVTQKGFLNFGLSVVTNVEVTLGGKIEWMRVGTVLPGRPAAQQGLFTGIEILAIDNIPVAQLTREDMLHALFEREAGDAVRLLVYSRHFGPLPRFILLQSRPRDSR